ncbi:hypothetical protein OH76DRAFT_830962 [Lentinus brumalis]|uniref:Uncharacterized protein n=1 Tax=Lentinus brumalis TaxID=2498619 RepID=A0A371D1T1_9APHY|nr:hypothetical protein OH76DRAFT_830962 [Polyporus brumalis]
MRQCYRSLDGGLSSMAIFSVSLSREVTMPPTYPSQGRSFSAGSSDSSSSLDASRSGSPILMRSESRVRGGMPARFPRCSMNADPTTLFAGDLLRPFAHDVVLHPLPPSLVRLHAREPSKAAVPRMYDRESTSSLASHAVSIHGCTYCTIEPALRSGALCAGAANGAEESLGTSTERCVYVHCFLPFG